MASGAFRIATASNRTDGPPENLWSAFRSFPSLILTPPTVGATISRVAPSASSALRKAPISFASTPSVTSAPTLRPAKFLGPFSTMLNDFDFPRSERTSTAGTAALIFPLRPSPAATLSGQSPIDIRKMGNHSLADGRFFDLAQFENQCRGDMFLLDRCLADVELASLAVVVGKTRRPQPDLRARPLRQGTNGTRIRDLLAGRPQRRANSARNSLALSDSASPYARPAGSGEKGTWAR